jgi:hypothetical protein
VNPIGLAAALGDGSNSAERLQIGGAQITVSLRSERGQKTGCQRWARAREGIEDGEIGMRRHGLCDLPVKAGNAFPQGRNQFHEDLGHCDRCLDQSPVADGGNGPGDRLQPLLDQFLAAAVCWVKKERTVLQGGGAGPRRDRGEAVRPRVYNPLNEAVLTYPTYVQRAIWTSSALEGRPINDEISFQSAEGLRFTPDVDFSYQLLREQVPHFYVKFRNDDLDVFTHGFFRDAVRNASRFPPLIGPKTSTG